MGDGATGNDLPVADPREAERRLWQAFGRGVLVDLRAGHPDADDPRTADGWDESRRVRAEVVAALLLGAVDPVAGYVAGVRLEGALVEGSVILRHGVVACAAELTGCRFTGEFVLAEARTQSVDLSGSVLETLDATAAEISGSLILDRCQARAINSSLAHIGGMLSLNGAHLANPGNTALSAAQMTVDGGMFCDDGFQSEGEIGLQGAHIGGQLALNGAHLANPGNTALSADGMTVGYMFCDDGFQSEGEIGLPGAQISGQLSLKGAHLANPGSDALYADRMTVDGDMFCDDGFRSEGEIRLLGAHISGQLSLNGAHLANLGNTALSADGMTVDGGMFCDDGFQSEGEIGLPGAHISGQLSLSGAHLANPGSDALYADQMTIGGDMFCQEGFQAEGTVRLPGAHIGGRLSLTGAHLANPGNIALRADGMTVDSDVFCGDGFQSEGEIRLPGAHIGGQLSLGGAHLANPGSDALSADEMTVDSDVFCGDGFQSEGEIRLPGAHIGGQLSLGGAHLANPGNTALTADRMTVGAGMVCSDGFRSEGGIRLLEAHIGGQLLLNGAHLANPGNTALSADQMTVDGGMFCNEGFQAEGEIRLWGVRITGQAGFLGAVLSNPDGIALNCETAQADSLLLGGVTVTGRIDLTSAQVRVLIGNPSGMPGRMLLDGFTYDELRPYAEARGPSGRLAWLAHAEADYRAQPYEQLAAYYRRLGLDEEARRVLVAKQRRRRAGLNLPGKITGYVLDALVGYGYRPARAFAWLIALLAAGSVYFTFNRPAPLDPAQHPHYQPVLYAADLLIPIVNLGQTDTWAPTGAAQWIAATLTALGWILATAVIAGVTRALTRT